MPSSRRTTRYGSRTDRASFPRKRSSEARGRNRMPNAGTGPLRIGLVGGGWVSEVCHLPALRDVREATVVAVADVDRERVDRMASRYGIERRYFDHRALVDDPQVEAVAVCVPSRAHLEVALAAIDAGK